MMQFKPSAGFVARVMLAVEHAELPGRRPGMALPGPTPSLRLRAALAACGAAIGLVNLARLWFSVLSPAICQ